MHSGGLPTEAASLLHGELIHVVVRHDDVGVPAVAAAIDDGEGVRSIVFGNDWIM